MTQAWVCPQCSQRNALDASECSACGRWASVFDLERTVEVGPDEVAEPDDATDDAGYATVDQEPSDEEGPTESPMHYPDVVVEPSEATEEVEQPASGRRILRWLVPVIAVVWIVGRQILEQL